MKEETTYQVDYFILDGARVGEDLGRALELNTNHRVLYSDPGERYLSQVAPYIFTFPGNGAFAEWVWEGEGRSWGIWVSAGIHPEDMYYHFRKFKQVRTEDGEELYFRFYDPRVLKMFLPTCDKAQIREFFGPVRYFITEGEGDQGLIRYWQENGVLRREELDRTNRVSNPKAADNVKNKK